MKRLLLLGLFYAMVCQLRSQEFQMSMFFQDAIGNRDSIVFGYDINGSSRIDTAFGEANLQAIPFDSEFEVRITNNDPADFSPSFETKKQIIENQCFQIFWLPRLQIDISCKHWPVTATWNPVDLNECVQGTVFTSCHPGGWVDACGQISNLDFAYMCDTSRVTFTRNFGHSDTLPSPGTGYVNDNLDSISTFWVVFLNEKDSILSPSQNWRDANTIIYPNPASDFLRFSDDSFLNRTLKVYAVSGELVAVKKILSNSIDIHFLPKGIYILSIFSPSYPESHFKILKQ